jgi:hypothetical protein
MAVKLFGSTIRETIDAFRGARAREEETTSPTKLVIKESVPECEEKDLNLEIEGRKLIVSVRQSEGVGVPPPTPPTEVIIKESNPETGEKALNLEIEGQKLTVSVGQAADAGVSGESAATTEIAIKKSIQEIEVEG